MVVKLLGILDLVCILALVFPTEISPSFTIACALYLLIKGGVFLLTAKDWISAIDVLVGIYLLFAAAGMTQIVIAIIAIVFLMQKSIRSLMR